MEKYKLGEISEFIRNGASIKQFDNADGYPITRIETISNLKIDFEKMGYANIYELGKYEDYLLKNGDILMSHINSDVHLGKSAVMEDDSKKIIHGMNLLCIRLKKEMANSKYMYYYFNHKLFRNKLSKIIKKSVNQASFSVTDLKKIDIEIPNIETQKKIVEVLNKAQSLIEKKKEQIDLLDKLVKSRLIEMFSNLNNENKLSLGDCTNFIDYRGKTPKLSEDGNIRMINAKSVGKGVFKYIDEYISEETYNSWMKRGFPNYGDILFVTEGHTFGNTCMIPKNVGKFAMGQRVITIQGNKGIINNSFLYQYMQTLEFKIKIDKYKTRSSAQGIRSKELQKILVPIPPMELQNEFAEFVTQTDSIRSKMEASLSELEDNFNSLMQKAFKGELF